MPHLIRRKFRYECPHCNLITSLIGLMERETACTSLWCCYCHYEFKGVVHTRYCLACRFAQACNYKKVPLEITEL